MEVNEGPVESKVGKETPPAGSAPPATRKSEGAVLDQVDRQERRLRRVEEKLDLTDDLVAADATDGDGDGDDADEDEDDADDAGGDLLDDLVDDDPQPPPAPRKSTTKRAKAR